MILLANRKITCIYISRFVRGDKVMGEKKEPSQRQLRVGQEVKKVLEELD